MLFYFSKDKPLDGWTTTKSPLLDWSKAYMHWQDVSKSRHFVQLNSSSSWLEFEGSQQRGELGLYRVEAKSGNLILYDPFRKLYIELTPTMALYGTSENAIEKTLSEGAWTIKNVPVLVPLPSTTTPAASSTPLTTTANDETANKVYVINRTMTVYGDIGASFDLYCATREIDNKAFVWISWLRRSGSGSPSATFPSNMKADKNLLQIVDFNDANEGQYECLYIKDLNVHRFVITLATKGNSIAFVCR